MSDAPVNVGMTPPHPGEFIRDEVLDVLGVSVSEAAEMLGVRRATLSNLVNGRASLSPEMALRIEKAFAVNMDMLLRMQAWYDAVAMRRHAADIEVKLVAAAAVVAKRAVAPKRSRLGSGLGVSPKKRKRDRRLGELKPAARRGRAAR